MSGYTCVACGETTGFHGHYSAAIDDYTCRRKSMGERILGRRVVTDDEAGSSDGDIIDDQIAGALTAPKKAVMLHEWDHGKRRLRLIAKADHTPGYEDEYVVEKLTQDALGEPRWDRVVSWRQNANPQGASFSVGDWLKTLNGLVDGIKSLLRDQR